MAVKLLFGEIQSNTDSNQYVIQKLTAFFKDLDAANENYRVVTRRYSPTRLPLTPKEEFPTVSLERWAFIEKGITCFINEMNDYYEPFEEEQIQEDFVSFLKEDFKPFPQGTVILKRITNFATLYYVKTNLIIVGEKWKTVPQKLNVKDTVVDDAIKAVLFLVKAMASGGLSNIGSRMINQLIGGNSIDLKQLEKDISQIVRDANVDQTVNEQDGVINGTINDFNTYYKKRRDSGASKNELYDWLVERENAINISLGILREKMFQEKGISTYIVGANIMICILQEMALQDPIVTDYHKSSNYKLLSEDINDFIDYITGLKSLILSKRIAQVSGIRTYKKCSSAGGGDVVCDIEYYYKDEYNNSFYGDFYDDNKHHIKGYDEATKSRNQLIQSLTEQMNWVDDVLNHWKELKTNPM
ncbi:hypothetical protein PDM87_02570 [Bacillus cereus]|uniref:hypothetical protein n=1 Tax=Bacillus cereus TaxID=1396 RepID=UPI00234C1ED2|nr:hypothetical protein [Bacillus cereus]MDA2046966.1 hypothetical protein [Bacillus cereus]MDC7726422.1 hypothetical protein [Bacillus cereus]